MAWEILRPLRVLRRFDGVQIQSDGTIVFGPAAFDALGQPARVQVLVDRERGYLGFKAAPRTDADAYGLFRPDGPESPRRACQAIRAFRRLRIRPASVQGPHDAEVSEGVLLLRIAEWAASE